MVRVTIAESPWMPLSPARSYPYPDGFAANATNVHTRGGCDNVLTTTTIQADGRIGEGITCRIETGKALVEAGAENSFGR